MTQEKLLAEELQSLGETGYTPLMEALPQQDRDQVERMLLEGANINAVGRKGLIALILSASRGNSDITRLLLEFGADTSATDI